MQPLTVSGISLEMQGLYSSKSRGFSEIVLGEYTSPDRFT
jgi:hypothetical protein